MTNQGNAGSTDWDYRMNGYSERSLEMLKSEEGQLNAIYACYGSAAQRGQLFEVSLERLVALLNDWLGNDDSVIGLERKTLGQLLLLFKKKFVEEIDEWVPEFLDEARKRRNFLIHEYFVERDNQMSTESGRFAILTELADIEAQLRRGEDLVNGLRVAVEETKMGERKEEVEGKTIFSVKLRSQ